jgi:hypothetical protein
VIHRRLLKRLDPHGCPVLLGNVSKFGMELNIWFFLQGLGKGCPLKEGSVRTEQGNIKKRYPVLVEGFVQGHVEAISAAEAQVLANVRYGPYATLRDPVEMNQSPENLEDEIGNRVFRITPCYRAEFIPVVRQFLQGDIKVPVGVQEETFGPVGSIVDEWFLKHPGIHVIHFGSTKDPDTSQIGFLVVYQVLMEVPTVPTLDEKEQSYSLLKNQQEVQRDFFCRLTTDLQSNEKLFTFARQIGVEWNPSKHPITERANCIQAIRKHMGWI